MMVRIDTFKKAISQSNFANIIDEFEEYNDHSILEFIDLESDDYYIAAEDWDFPEGEAFAKMLYAKKDVDAYNSVVDCVNEYSEEACTA